MLKNLFPVYPEVKPCVIEEHIRLIQVKSFLAQTSFFWCGAEVRRVENDRSGFVLRRLFLVTLVKIYRSDAVENDQLSGRPVSSRTPEIIEKIRHFVANDR
ncbi:hypothetical protein TNCV_3472001 [Trichonephila clavipes]|nr:hypothetical protein TNCV_3472001 [Trichonephila clavipes]